MKLYKKIVNYIVENTDIENNKRITGQQIINEFNLTNKEFSRFVDYCVINKLMITWETNNYNESIKDNWFCPTPYAREFDKLQTPWYANNTFLQWVVIILAVITLIATILPFFK